MGTMIQQRKLGEGHDRGKRFQDHSKDVKGNNDLPVLTQPEIIEEIHSKYLRANADIIETNTFNAQRISMADYQMQDLADEMNVEAAKLARRAADAWTAKRPRIPLAGTPLPPTRVAVLQNGIDHVSRVSPLIAGATVVPTVVYYNGERLATDRVRLRHVQGPDLAVPNDANGHAFASLLEGSGLSVSPNADFTTLLWRKLLINSVANPLTALTRQRQMVLRRDMRVLCLSVLEEAAAIGRAEGTRLAPDAPQRTLAALFSVTYFIVGDLDVLRHARRPSARSRRH